MISLLLHSLLLISLLLHLLLLISYIIAFTIIDMFIIAFTIDDIFIIAFTIVDIFALLSSFTFPDNTNNIFFLFLSNSNSLIDFSQHAHIFTLSVILLSSLFNCLYFVCYLQYSYTSMLCVPPFCLYHLCYPRFLSPHLFNESYVILFIECYIFNAKHSACVKLSDSYFCYIV